MWRRLWAICRKEWIQIRRDPRTLAVIWLLPITQLLLFGYGMDFDLKRVHVAVADYDRSQASRVLVAAFDQSEHFEVIPAAGRAAEVERMVVDARARLGVVIPAGFERALRLGQPAPVQVLLDGADPTTGGTALGYTRGLIESFSREWLREHPIRAVAPAESGSDQAVFVSSRQPAALDVRARVLYNPELRSANFLVPGLMAVILTMIAALLTSNAMAREKERGTFEALIATPVKPLELMVGKLLPYVLLSAGNVLLVMLAGWLFFGVWPRGDVWLLAGLSLIFLLAALGTGLLVSTVAPTQQIALMAAIMVTVVPSMLLSGFAFPLRNMPPALRTLSNLFPATHYLVIVRGIYLKAVGWDVLWRPALILAGFATFFLLACARRFRKQL